MKKRMTNNQIQYELERLEHCLERVDRIITELDTKVFHAHMRIDNFIILKGHENAKEKISS